MTIEALQQEIEELKKRIEMLEQRPVTYPNGWQLYPPINNPQQYPTMPTSTRCNQCGTYYYGQNHQCYYLGNQSLLPWRKLNQ